MQAGGRDVRLRCEALTDFRSQVLDHVRLGDNAPLRMLPELEEAPHRLAAQVVQHALGDHRFRRRLQPLDAREFERRIAEPAELLPERRFLQRMLLRPVQRPVPRHRDLPAGVVADGDAQRLADPRHNARRQGSAPGDAVAGEGGFQPAAERRVVGLPDDAADGDGRKVDAAAVE